MRSTTLGVIYLAASVTVSGQIVCTMTQVRAPREWKDECNQLVAVQLKCTGGTPTPARQNVPLMNIMIESDFPIASQYQKESTGQLLPLTPSMSVDNPGTAHEPDTSPTIGVGGNGVDYANGSVPNYFQGSQDGQFAVVYTAIPFDPSPSGRTLTVWFWIKLCGATSGSSNPVAIMVTAKITPATTFTEPQLAPDIRAIRENSTTAATYTVTPSSLNLGDDVNCMLYRFTSGSAPSNSALNASLLGSSPSVPSVSSAMLSYYTLFPACLRVRATGFQDDVTQFYDNDLGYTYPGLPSPFANYGTELQAVFNNIPAGVNVFVQSSITSPLGSVLLTSPGMAVGSTGLTQIPVSNGSAIAIWETQTASLTATGSFAIPVYFAYQAGVASPADITVVQSLGSPPGGIQAEPVPANLIQPVLFSINSGISATPKLTAALDSRPCIIGVTFSTNNACTPTSGPFVNVTSDSGPVTLNSPTVTLPGGLTANALGFGLTTPSQVQILPKANNASAGIYQGSLSIGPATGSATPISVPFSVTVLPPNNPVFELNAVSDAFSYQPETIAPGQIYTIFGSNFGSSTLVSGTLDSSGKLSTTVANTQVMFDGIASPLLYVVNGQLSGVAPFELAGKSSTNVQIISNGMASPTVAVPVVPAAISIASVDGSGGNGGVVLNQDGTLNSPSNPASAGDTVVIYGAYAGSFANGVVGTDGRTTVSAPYPQPAGTPSVTIGGVAATNIPYFGNAPGFLESVMQINVVIPAGVPSSPYDSLVISAGGVSSTGWTMIAVQ